MKYPEERYKWFAGADEERLTVGPCDSREAAIDEALDSQTYSELEPDVEHKDWRVSIYVCQAVRPEVADMEVDADRLLDDLDGRYEEFAYEEGLFENVTREEIDDLALSLTEVLHRWAERHGAHFPSWRFQESRHGETVVLSHPVPEEPSPA